MGKYLRDWRWSAAAALILLALIVIPIGCSTLRPAPVDSIAVKPEPVIRVLIHEEKPEALLSAEQPPILHTTANPNRRRVNVPAGSSVAIKHTGSGWTVGNVDVGSGELMIEPASGSWLTINDRPYRGTIRCVVRKEDVFDVVNYVRVDDYLYSVLPREMFSYWHLDAYKAQAIIARTYALYEKQTQAPGMHFDVFTDTRSQVYGGMKDESLKSRTAVDQTAGIVAVHGPAGQERIFKAYFSSCCGGLSASSADVFGGPWSEPLSEQNRGTTCNFSKHFNWGPIIVPRAELTKRFRAWGASNDHPLKNIATIKDLRVAQNNRVGRPVRFVATDDRGDRYSLKAEELRWATNFNAKDPATKLKSSFCRPVVQGQTIHFVDGHGYGHGVGMCQHCCQARAVAGVPHEQIVTGAYPGSKLARAY